MVDISVKLEIAGEDIEADETTGAIKKEMTESRTLKLKATVEPADVVPTQWVWEKNGSDIDGDADELEIEYTKGEDVSYRAKATPPGGTPKPSNRVRLSPKASAPAQPNPEQAPPAGGAVDEIEVGEYDRGFAVLAGLGIAVLTAVALCTLLKDINLEFPAGDSAPPKGVSYLERLRGFAVVAATSAGIVALGIGSWLAALEVRGRLKKVIRPAAKDKDRAFGVTDPSELVKVLSKLRGTVAVLVAAVTLLLGALWTTGRTPGAADPTPSPTPTVEAEPEPEPTVTGDE